MVPPGLEALTRQAGLEAIRIEPLAGDVGRRRYYRLHSRDNRTAIGVVYPPEEDDSRRRWVTAQNLLRARVRVPELVADDGRGNQIVEDFGAEDLATTLTGSPALREEWLARAVDAAAEIAAMSDPGLNAAFDTALFRRELDLAREAVFDRLLDAPLSAAERDAHDGWAASLVDEILSHPGALCHRDFHANNLFGVSSVQGEVGVIDFQDLRRGPDSYDLASLLWERSTLEWMNEEIAASVITRFAAARGMDASALSVRLRRVLLQRGWKVCGTFARAIAEGRGNAYRRHLPPELALVRRLLTDAPADRAFASILESRCGPVC